MLLSVADFAELAQVPKYKIYQDIKGKLKEYVDKESGTIRIDSKYIYLYKPQAEQQKEEAEPQKEVFVEVQQEQPKEEVEPQTEPAQTQEEILKNIIETQKEQIEYWRRREETAQEELREKNKTLEEITQQLIEITKANQVLLAKQQEIKQLEGERQTKQHSIISWIKHKFIKNSKEDN